MNTHLIAGLTLAIALVSPQSEAQAQSIAATEVHLAYSVCTGEAITQPEVDSYDLIVRSSASDPERTHRRMRPRPSEQAPRENPREGSQNQPREENLAQLLERHFELYAAQVASGAVPDAAKSLESLILEHVAVSPQSSADFAWRLLQDHRDGAEPVAFAVELAALAYETSNGQVPDIGDTYAYALFRSGQVYRAVVLQRKVVEAEENAGFRSRLDQYEAALRLTAA